MGTIMTWIIGAIVVGSGIFLLLRAIKREAMDGKCAGCSGGSTCSSCPTALPLKNIRKIEPSPPEQSSEAGDS